MHIVVLGTKGIPNIIGGVEKHAEEIYPRIVAMGHRVTIVRMRRYAKVPRDKYYKGVKIVDIFTFPFPILDLVFYHFISLIYAIFRRPDVLHIHTAGPSIFALPARMFGLKVVFTAHTLLENRVLKDKILNFSEKIGLKYAHKVIVVAQYIADAFVQRYQYTKTIFIPNGISASSNCNGDKYIRLLGLEPQKYIIAVGRFDPIKGFDLLFQVMPYIEAKGYKLVFVGDNLYETEYSKNIKKRASEYKIVLTGYIVDEKLDEIYQNAALFIQPSFQEGNSLALLDAMGYGLEVLVSDIPANREVGLTDDDMFKVGDSTDLAEKLKAKLNRGLERKEYSAEFYKNHDWDRIAEMTCNILIS